MMRVVLLTGLAVAAMAASVLYASSVQRSTADEHGNEVRVTQAVLTDLYRASSALDTYALTGETEALVDREVALERLDRTLGGAARSPRGNPDEQRLVDQQREHIEELLAVGERALEARSESERRAAVGASSEARHHLIDEITELNAALGARQRERQEDEDRNVALVAPMLIVVLGLMFGGAAFVVARRARAARLERMGYRARQERFGEAMQVAESQGEAHTLLKAHLERSIDGAAVTVLNRNNSADRLEATTPLDSESPLAERLPQATPRSCLAVRLSRPFQQADRNEVYDCQVCGGLAAGTSCQPLLVGGEVIGSVLTERDACIDATDGERISQAVAQAAPVLANLRNLAIAEMRAATDSLTGLPNRRAVDDTLLRMLAQAGRTFEPMSVVLLDLDHFKTINDTLGHDRGDEVLAGVGACLREAIRESDFAGRSGGEEFVLFLAGTDRSGAVRVAEKVRATMRALRVAGMERSVTASFGVACFPDDAVDAPALMRSADRALYAAKRAGRDRIESSSTGATADGEAQLERSTQ
jgi:diguanylate cyclase (GGDEF)-like protein